MHFNGPSNFKKGWEKNPEKNLDILVITIVDWWIEELVSWCHEQDVNLHTAWASLTIGRLP